MPITNPVVNSRTVSKVEMENKTASEGKLLTKCYTQTQWIPPEPHLQEKLRNLSFHHCKRKEPGPQEVTVIKRAAWQEANTKRGFVMRWLFQ